MDIFWAAPPVTRTIVALTAATSVLVHMGLVSGRHIIYYTPWVFGFPPQIWRILTAFLLTGPKLGMLMDPYFLWMYGSQLETGSTRFTRPGDFFTYIAFVELVIVAIGGGLLGGYTFLDALTLAFAYTHAQDNPNGQVSFFIITMRAKLLPFAMLAMSFVSAGPEAALKQGAGLLAAHLYDFLTRIWPTHGGGTNYLQTPAVIDRWFNAEARTPQARPAGSAIPARAPGQASGARQAGASTTSGFSASIPGWQSRGQGRRLGGD